MTATFKVSLSIVGLLFGLCLLDSMCKASTTTFVEIETDFLCQISEWQTIRLKYRRKFNSTTSNLSSLQNFSSFWRHHKEEFKKTTEKQLFLAGKYTPNCTIFCSCDGRIAAYASSNNSVLMWNNTSISFPLEIPSIGSHLLGVRFVAVNNGLENELQVYLRPADTTRGDVSFNLLYCWFDEHDLALDLWFDSQAVCPTYTTVRLECSEHVQDVYGVANSNGFTCAASVPDVQVYSKYKFYIVTSGDGFTTASEVFGISTYQSSSSFGPILNGKRGKFELVLISPKLSNVTAKPIQFRRIDVSWKKNYAWEYILSYNCSNSVNRSGIISTKNSTIIINRKFQPAIKCRVCAQTLKVRDSIPSEPVCTTTRLFIESPSRAPTITCDSDTCPSSSDGESRNVTITCEFPLKSTWNGALTRLLAKYRSEGTHEYKDVSEFNPTSCRSRLTGLRTKTTYFVTLQACNSEGCSGRSREVKIASFYEKIDGNSFTLWWLVAILLATVLVGGVIAVVYYLRGKKPDRDSSSDHGLPEIEPPAIYDPLEVNAEGNCKGYHQLPPENTKPDEPGSDTDRHDVNDNLPVC